MVLNEEYGWHHWNDPYPHNGGFYLPLPNDYCDCERCPCCGKIKRNVFNRPNPNIHWTTTSTPNTVIVSTRCSCE